MRRAEDLYRLRQLQLSIPRQLGIPLLGPLDNNATCAVALKGTTEAAEIPEAELKPAEPAPWSVLRSPSFCAFCDLCGCLSGDRPHRSDNCGLEVPVSPRSRESGWEPLGHAPGGLFVAFSRWIAADSPRRPCATVPVPRR